MTEFVWISIHNRALRCYHETASCGVRNLDNRVRVLREDVERVGLERCQQCEKHVA